MEYARQEQGREKDWTIDNLSELRRFAGSPDQFWPTFLDNASRLVGAVLGLLLVKMKEGESWKAFAAWPGKSPEFSRNPALAEKIEAVAEACSTEGSGQGKTGKLQGLKGEGFVLGVRLELEEEGRSTAAVLLLDGPSAPRIEEALTRLKLVANAPTVYQLRRLVQQAKLDVVQFAEALDFMVLLNGEKRFMAAAMTFCNELASRYRCERVSLGWIKGEYVRVQAISHMERFEKKMDAVQALETAMEEALDQDEEILFPRPEGKHFVIRDHEAFAKEYGSSQLLSIPIRLDDAAVGVATCERTGEPFTEAEVRGLRILCDQAGRRLGDLKRHDRWFGARMVAGTKEALGKLLGVEHTFAKALGLLIFAALAFLVFGQWDYRVEAPFMLKTDDLTYLPAPFDGYIDKVHVKVGDIVKEGAPLLSLDIRELLLEESTAVANQNRYFREAEKARAQGAIADMVIATAMEAQAKARLSLVRYHLDHADVKTPFSGIVVEGELHELLGAPVKKGDVLFKVARLEKMYAELKVDERDIHEITAQATGEISFVSRPDLTFPIKLERIDPVAVVDQEANVFLVRALFPDQIGPWWRPGMSGVAKVTVGKRNILWIFTHRTIDFLRLYLWW
jgi:RND family efflux transporter MFP subunit